MIKSNRKRRNFYGDNIFNVIFIYLSKRHGYFVVVISIIYFMFRRIAFLYISLKTELVF